MAKVLLYGRAAMRRWKRALWAMALFAIVLGIGCILNIRVRFDNAWVCAICGAEHRRNDWSFGFSTSDRLVSTALERWIDGYLGPHEHDWRHVKGTGWSLLGHGISSGHGLAPPILPSRQETDWLVAAWSDEQLRSFVQVLQTGSDEDQHRAVEEAAEAILDEMDRKMR